MKLQTIANKIARHFAKQKEQSADDFFCKYRIEDENGKRLNACAVGCLIPKKYYNSDIEEQIVHEEADNNIGKLLVKLGLWEHHVFLREAQKIHDNHWEERNEKSAALCKSYGLKYCAE